MKDNLRPQHPKFHILRKFYPRFSKFYLFLVSLSYHCFPKFPETATVHEYGTFGIILYLRSTDFRTVHNVDFKERPPPHPFFRGIREVFGKIGKKKGKRKTTKYEKFWEKNFRKTSEKCEIFEVVDVYTPLTFSNNCCYWISWIR